MKSIQNVLVLVVAVAIGLFVKRLTSRSSEKYKWHQGPQWDAFLRVYDAQAQQQFHNCQSQLIESRFASTQVHACGDKRNPAVFLLHGMGSSSLIYGDWLMPRLSEKFYTIAIDTCGDTGRTLPVDGDPTNCPKTREQVVEWIFGIADALNVDATRTFSLIGYSYGSFLASEIALSSSSSSTTTSRVDKLVLIAPAAVFAPIENGFVLRAVAMHISKTLFPWSDSLQDKVRDWFFAWMLADPAVNFEESMSEDHKALRKTSDNAATPHAEMNPQALSDERLQQMTSTHPTMLVIGMGEVVTNATLAVERATAAGAKVQLYENAGHLLLMEHPRQAVIGVIEDFLLASPSDGDKSSHYDSHK